MCTLYRAEAENMKTNTLIGMVRVTNVFDAQMRLKVVRRLLRERGVIVTQAQLVELAISALDADCAAALLTKRSAAA
jgi:head-tail adaptor